MMLKSLAALVLVAVAGLASASEPQRSDPNLPLALRFQFDGPPPNPLEACNTETARAASAVSLRDKGKTKQELAAVLPELAKNQPWMAWVAASILDDVYAFPEVQRYPYFAYRSASCYRRLAGKTAPPNFSAVSKGVLACQAKFGSEPSEAHYLCIDAAVTAGSK